MTAAELCSSATRERVDGGYRVDGGEAAGVCRDRVRQIRGEDR
jgi:hypothetical protein